MISSLQQGMMARIDAEIAAVAKDAARAAQTPLVLLRAPRFLEGPIAGPRALAVTWVLCLALTVVNLERGGLAVASAPPTDPEVLVTGLEISAALDAAVVEAYRTEHGILPSSLDEVGLGGDESVGYERLGRDAFRVIASHGIYQGIFDSRLEAEEEAAEEARRAAEAARREAEMEEWAAESAAWLDEASQWNARTPYEEELR